MKKRRKRLSAKGRLALIVAEWWNDLPKWFR